MTIKEILVELTGLQEIHGPDTRVGIAMARDYDEYTSDKLEISYNESAKMIEIVGL